MPQETEAQQRLAKLRRLKELRGKIGGAEKAQPLVPPPAEKRGILDRVVGAGDAALSLLTGAMKEAFVTGPQGVFAAGKEIVSGEKTPDTPSKSLNIVGRIASDIFTGDDTTIQKGADAVNESRANDSFLTGPYTEAGKETLQNLAPAFEKIEEVTQGAGNMVLDATGSPLAATVAKSTLESLPLGSRSGAKVDGRFVTPEMRTKDLAELNDAAKRQGIDLNANLETQREQVIESAVNKSEGQVSTAEGFDQVQQSVIDSRATAKADVDQKFATARSTGEDAGVTREMLDPLKAKIDETLSDFDLDVPEMARVRNSVKMLDDLMERDPNSIVTMNEVAKFQRRLRTQSADATANGANRAIAAQTQKWLQNVYDNDMLSGDPQAVTNWRMANDAHSAMKETFDDNATIRMLHEREADPRQVKNWILGNNAVGSRQNSSLVVNKLGEILGKDSPEFGALRREVVFDIVEPLLRETPNYTQFGRRYDQFMRNNADLSRELMGDSAASLGELRNFAASIGRGESSAISIDLNRGIAVALFGHGIAQQGMKVNLATKIINKMAGRSEATRKRQIMADMLGYDPEAPLLSVAPALAVGTIQTGIDETQ